MTTIRREYTPPFVVTASSSASSTAGVIPYGPFSGGIVLCANTNGATQITWHAAANAEDTPVKLYGTYGVVTTSLTVGAHPIPEQAFGARYVYPIISGATTCALTVGLKG